MTRPVYNIASDSTVYWRLHDPLVQSLRDGAAARPLCPQRRHRRREDPQPYADSSSRACSAGWLACSAARPRRKASTTTTAVKGDRKVDDDRHDRSGSSTWRRRRSTTSTSKQEDLHGHDLRGDAAADARGARRRRRRTPRSSSRAEKPEQEKPTKEVEIDFDVKETGQKKQIAGYDAHEIGDDDHRPREGQDARGGRRHGDDDQHVARDRRFRR